MKKFAFASFALLGITLIVTVAWVKIQKYSGNNDDSATFSQSGGATPGSAGFINLGDDLTPMFNQSMTFGNLKLIPVGAGPMYISKAKSKAKYTPLKQAMEEGKVKVSEQGSGGGGSSRHSERSSRPNGVAGTLVNPLGGSGAPHGSSDGGGGVGNSVNSLTIENASEDTVYIMAGEVVKGGHQDRVIAQDVVLKPHGGKLDMGVFCVEPHRWQAHPGGGSMFTSTYWMASNTVRREATVSKNQSNVWHEVGEVTKSHGATTQSGTYTALENSSSYTDKREEYLAAFKNFVQNKLNTIGVIAVSGDKVIACDLFVNPELFAKQFELLLHSYITDAISNGGEVKITEESITKYFENFAKGGKIDEAKVLENGLVGKNAEGEWIHVARY